MLDYEKKIVDIVKAYLERDSYKVIVAYDGRLALPMARGESPVTVAVSPDKEGVLVSVAD